MLLDVIALCSEPSRACRCFCSKPRGFSSLFALGLLRLVMLCCSEPLRACHPSFPQAHSCGAFIALRLKPLRDIHRLCPRPIEAYHRLLFLCPLPDDAQPVFSQVGVQLVFMSQVGAGKCFFGVIAICIESSGACHCLFLAQRVVITHRLLIAHCLKPNPVGLSSLCTPSL